MFLFLNMISLFNNISTIERELSEVREHDRKISDEAQNSQKDVNFEKQILRIYFI
jgi:hypothetical protein